ncbi:hypothetical protein [Allorhizocola rhizosphaerae]|uniref:hypothetical protein n=1 Tax=Allorhizocola rhizosphaerae TaxID=1872709 RepID=UPI000E3E2994|nr:hypothetical protein [Allorhizocola rhizosphaerae]
MSGVSGGEVVLWVLGGLAVIGVLVFLGIFLKFVAKAAVGYVRHRPYPALATFAISGGLASFITTFVGGSLLLGVGVGLATGLAVLLLVAIELGAD